MKWLLVFVPLATALHFVIPDNPGLVFFSAVVAIIPLAAFLGEATEHLAFHTGDAIGGLLNATFGNLPELLILTAVLRSGFADMVLAGLYGAILVNAFLATGLAMMLGGFKHHTQKFQSEKTNEFATLLAIAVFALAVISIIGSNPDTSVQSEDQINFLLSALLIASYAMFLWYSLVTHKDIHVSSLHTVETAWNVKKSLLWLIGTSIAVTWMSEIISGAVESAMHQFNLNPHFVGAIVLAIVGGVAEMASAVRAARKDRMDLALTITMGASVQISLFVAPTLVIISYIFLPSQLHLHFSSAAVLLLFMAVFIVSSISRQGHSTWYKGALLVMLYIILGIGFHLIP